MARHYRFEVRGSGEFPWDMLRYDRVYPTTEPAPDRYAEADKWKLIRTVKVEGQGCTPDRWASFGWKVVDAEDVSTSVKFAERMEESYQQARGRKINERSEKSKITYDDHYAPVRNPYPEVNFIVVSTWCERDRNGNAIESSMTDHWIAEESYQEALEAYESSLEQVDSLWSASICVPIKSTDYPTDNGYLDYILTRGE